MSGTHADILGSLILSCCLIHQGLHGQAMSCTRVGPPHALLRYPIWIVIIMLLIYQKALYLDLALDEVRRDGFNRDQCHLKLFECKVLFYLGREVLVTFDLATFLDACQHYDQLNLLLPNHPPEIFDCLRQGSLGSNEQLVVLTD